MAAGRFITFEGGEGTGKSTQVRLLKDRLEQSGFSVTATREPGGTDAAEAIRNLLLSPGHPGWLPDSEALLQYAARKDHVEKKIRPALEAGQWVISDRFADSTFAYQGFAQGLGYEHVHQLHALVLGGFEPDLTFLLDLPVDVGLSRTRSRAGDNPDSENRFEKMDRDFHENLRTAFQGIANNAPGRCVIVDADQSVEDIAESIWQTVQDRFKIAA